MKKIQNNNANILKNGGSSSGNGFLPFSINFVSSCIKTVSFNGRADDHSHKDQVLWACFDRLELGPTTVKQVLLIGYSNGFQVLDVEDASDISELVSKRDDPVTFLQMQPAPAKYEGCEGFRKSHPMLLVVASDAMEPSGPTQNGKDCLSRDGFAESHVENLVNPSTTVRFYSLSSHNYVHILRFRSTVYMIRCSQQIVAVGLAAQIYCFDALTLENKFSVLTYPIPQLKGLGSAGVNNGYGPMAVGPRWLAYASNNPLHWNIGRLSPQSISPSPGVSPSTSPSSGNLVARYAIESSKHLAAGLINLGDMGYKTLSKYCHEFIPDGSSPPVSSNASGKMGRNLAHSADMDAAGMVVIKDFKSKAIIAQFRAHTSPISALCFDPSGTLIVTASINGNNINIFRVMPSSSQNGSGTHVHLYKLRRGMTSAVTQDICFSHFSQWVAIVSSRGTCHVYVLSPFGGETGLHLVNSHADRSTLVPALSIPWWSTSCFLTNQQSSPPPPAITLSVVSRIKNGGWLSSMSNAASGKVLVPSGVVAAVFHRALCQTMQSTSLNNNVLEHLLVFSPSGHLLQYELLPSLGGEQGDNFTKNGLGSLMQEEELRVKVEPVRWWDVCRRADWPEREEDIHGITIGRHDSSDPVTGNSSCDDNASEDKALVKPVDRAHWYLSNAEVQIRSGRTPIWQNSKISFYMMDTCGSENQKEGSNQTGGEIGIEKIPIREIQIRRKDLLPISDHFHGINLAYGDEREIVNVGYTPSIVTSSSEGKSDESMASKAKSISIEVTGKSNPGYLMKSGSLYDYHESGMATPISDICSPAVQNDSIRFSSVLSSLPPNHHAFGIISASPESPVNFSIEENYVVNSRISPTRPYCIGAPGETPFEVSQVDDVDGTSRSSTKFSGVTNVVKEGQGYEDIPQPVSFVHYFQKGYCDASTNSASQELATNLADIGNNQHPLDKEKDEDDEESDELLGGVFAFSEEG